MKKNIKLAYLFPDILNLHGDRGNVLAFERVAKDMGIPFETVRVDNPDEELNIKDYDIILFSPGEIKSVESLVEKIGKYREDFEEYINENKYLIVTGTTVTLFGGDVIRIDNKPAFNGLGLFDFSSKERQWVYGDDIIFTTNINGKDMEITACQIQMVDIELKNEDKEFGKVKYGMGNNNSGVEGIRKNNAILTNALGPVFVKNPWFAKEILKEIADKKGIEYSEENLDFSLEIASKETLDEFILSK